MKTILYITYDGILEPLGQSQVLKYLEPLSKKYKILILSFEKKFDITEFNILKERLNKKNIQWYKMRYHKKPKILSSLYDIFVSIFFSFYLSVRFKVNIIHTRSYVPALIGMIMKLFLNKKIIFDMRGFWADERVDGGIWSKNSLIYKITKRLEIFMLKYSDKIVTLTKISKEILIKDFIFLNNNKIEVIPTCVDLSQFNYKNYRKINNKNTFVVGYLGSIGTWYEFDKVIIFFQAIKKEIKNAKLNIISHSDSKEIRNIITKFNLDDNDIIINNVKHSEIHNFIKNFDISTFFIKQCFSKKASCPTKLAESLAMGIPVVTGSDIGDTDNIILESKNKIGIIIKEFNQVEILLAIKTLKKTILNKELKLECFNAAKKYFDLSVGVSKYEKIYDSI